MELEELIRSIDIVEYISQYVDLEQKGDEYWGLSCFKTEKTPSFSVRRNPPFFYDYSSGCGGNVFSFVKLYHRCSGAEAVEILKKYAGIEGKLENGAPKMAATVACRKYMKPKGTVKTSSASVLPENTMEKYEKRDDKLAVWEAEGISRASLDKFGVRYDSFSDRLVYPIRNADGKIVNVGGRTLDPLWKEKKLRKYTYFHSWGTMDVIYGLSENMESILDKHEIILFEGAKSVLLADTWGVHNTGAILTSHLNPSQLKLLAKLGCGVVFALDRDVDVKDDKNIAKLKHYVRVTAIRDDDHMLGAKDAPVDKGQEVFQALYANYQRYI